jgi:hypothetical protein
MQATGILTEEKANALFQRISKSIEENKVARSADIIIYAMKEAWIAGFDEGQTYRG